MFFVSLVINWKSNCATSSYWKKDWNVQISVVTLFSSTWMLQIYRLKTMKPSTANPAAYCLSQSFCHNLLHPFQSTDLIIRFKIWEVRTTYCFVPEPEADSPSSPPSYLLCCQLLLSSAFSGHHLDYLLGKHKEKRNQCPRQFANSIIALNVNSYCKINKILYQRNRHVWSVSWGYKKTGSKVIGEIKFVKFKYTFIILHLRTGCWQALYEMPLNSNLAISVFSA